MDPFSSDSPVIRSSIDIGTNSVLFLVAEAENGSLKVIEEKQRIPRLGRGVDRDRTLHPDSMQRVLDALNEYKDYLEQNYPGISDHTIVTATSAVRDAANREDFLNRIQEETGWQVRLLSGEEEAKTTFAGALSVLPPSENRSVIIDIGGGSTEFVYGNANGLEMAQSLDMGSVRFTERFLPDLPPKTAAVEALRTEARRMAETLPLPQKPFKMVGVAGTVTSIAAIERGMDAYRAEEINGSVLTLSVIEQTIARFLQLTPVQIEEQHPVFLKGRGDVILAGLLILEQSMKWAGAEEILVSTGGIRHGVLMG